MYKCVGDICTIIDKDNKFFSAISYNSRFLWVKFFLADDKPNKNGVRIPKEEFENVIKTGTFAPIKIFFAEGQEQGHLFSKPIGVITHLMVQEEDDISKVVGIAAIWKEEFPEIAKYVSEKVESGEGVRVSWELYAEEVESEEYEGIKDLKSVEVTAVAIVKEPAYGDRTPIFEVSEVIEAEKWSRAYINDLPDCAFLYIEPGGEKDEEGKTKPRSLRHLPVKDHNCNIDRPHLVNAIQRLSQSKTGVSGGKRWLTEELRQRLLNKARKMLEEINNKEKSEMEELEQLKQENEELKSKVAEMEKELEELRAFKAEIEAEVEKQRRLMEIKQKFQEAGIEKDDEYFDENKEKLLSMDDAALEFLLQELIAFKKQAEEIKKQQKSEVVPNFPTSDANDLIAAIRARIRQEKNK